MANSPAPHTRGQSTADRLAAGLAASQEREARLMAAHEFYAAEREHDRGEALRLELEGLRPDPEPSR
ncbi:hypothetical protein [Streptomyces sp. NPDC051567]|uniref:hypothetical protein n=1 Tax=Streptomyces sp. NPDC051567 TaxID=3365660 RepID=UPI0037A7AD27